MGDGGHDDCSSKWARLWRWFLRSISDRQLTATMVEAPLAHRSSV
jgi:hypothetical protein